MQDTAITLEAAEVELANAHGPFSHGTWAGKGITIGNEEALEGRGALLVSLIRSAILERFSLDELAEMTLVDVGCYDGWVTCQLAQQFPLRRLIGIEPRQKNIDKGRIVRELLDIETRCEFRQGSIETLSEVLQGEQADILICVGVLHHLRSTAESIGHLHAVCRRMLFIETICLPPGFEDERLRRQLELKDLPYLYRKPVFGVTGHKLESGYYDGSATRLSVVSNPSVEAIRMFLDVQGFSDIRVVADPVTYSAAVIGGLRRAAATCLTAVIDPARDPAREVATWIEDYEGGLVHTLLPGDLVDMLFAEIQGRSGAKRSLLGFIVKKAMRATGWRLDVLLWWLRRSIRDRNGFEILKNLRFAPHDKIGLEMGKVLLARGETMEAEAILTGITHRLNADWRSVYRAFCLLAWCCRKRGDSVGAKRYEDLCRLANPQFPEKVLASSSTAFRSL